MAGGADHHLLLALAHRQAGDHAAAAEVYRRLSEVAPGRARVWLGLGVSLEALERFDEATTAYRRAAGGDDVQAARFARQRLAAIERRNGGS
jgi:Flp pilus assembly protein TadD